MLRIAFSWRGLFDEDHMGALAHGIHQERQKAERMYLLLKGAGTTRFGQPAAPPRAARIHHDEPLSLQQWPSYGRALCARQKLGRAARRWRPRPDPDDEPFSSGAADRDQTRRL